MQNKRKFNFVKVYKNYRTHLYFKIIFMKYRCFILDYFLLNLVKAKIRLSKIHFYEELIMKRFIFILIIVLITYFSKPLCAYTAQEIITSTIKDHVSNVINISTN